MSSSQSFHSYLADALAGTKLTIDQIAEETKISRPSLKAMFGDADPAALPPRVYLRGHVKLLAKQLGLDVAEALAKFDQSYPEVPRDEDAVDAPKSPAVAVAVAAGLGGIAILTLAVAFTR